MNYSRSHAENNWKLKNKKNDFSNFSSSCDDRPGTTAGKGTSLSVARRGLTYGGKSHVTRSHCSRYRPVKNGVENRINHGLIFKPIIFIQKLISFLFSNDFFFTSLCPPLRSPGPSSAFRPRPVPRDARGGGPRFFSLFRCICATEIFRMLIHDKTV